jgi:hypothetical protein
MIPLRKTGFSDLEPIWNLGTIQGFVTTRETAAVTSDLGRLCQTGRSDDLRITMSGPAISLMLRLRGFEKHRKMRDQSPRTADRRRRDP